MTNVKEMENCVLFFSLAPRKLGIALEEDAGRVDPHVICKNMGHPNFSYQLEL